MFWDSFTLAGDFRPERFRRKLCIYVVTLDGSSLASGTTV